MRPPINETFPTRIWGRIFNKREEGADLDLGLLTDKGKVYLVCLHSGAILHILEYSNFGVTLLQTILSGLKDNGFEWQALDIDTYMLFGREYLETKINEWAFRPD